jgi:hypothetical protein
MGDRAASRWPHFIPAAKHILGPRGILWSLPIHLDDAPIGTISVYGLDGDALAEPIHAAQAVADAAAMILAADPSILSEPSGAGPWAARAVVHQAAGKLIAQLGISAEDALAVLRSYAFTTDTQLTQVARAVRDGKVDLSDR